jgi:hypothetical protein
VLLFAQPRHWDFTGIAPVWVLILSRWNIDGAYGKVGTTNRGRCTDGRSSGAIYTTPIGPMPSY